MHLNCRNLRYISHLLVCAILSISIHASPISQAGDNIPATSGHATQPNEAPSSPRISLSGQTFNATSPTTHLPISETPNKAHQTSVFHLPPAAWTGQPTPDPIPITQPTPEPTLSTTSTTTHHVSPGTIFGGVLGGVIFVACCVGLAHCAYRYRRTPPRDRVAGLLSRHYLQREMEALANAPLTRRSSIPEPPPPAYQNAPAYEDVTTPRSGEYG